MEKRFTNRAGPETVIPPRPFFWYYHHDSHEGMPSVSRDSAELRLRGLGSSAKVPP